MASLTGASSTMSTISVPQLFPRSLKSLKFTNVIPAVTFRPVRAKHPPICPTELNPWEPSQVKQAPAENSGYDFLQKTSNIFETLGSENTAKAPLAKTKEVTYDDESNQPLAELQFLKWPMWLLGPALLLSTGMVPLWLPISSIFLSPNIASMISLIGLDCIFNVGATLFLMMANSCSLPKRLSQNCNSKPPFSYQFWNMVANVTGFIIPLLMLFGSQKGFVQPQLSSIPFTVLLGPYLLLPSVQILTELLTWHTQSPVKQSY